MNINEIVSRFSGSSGLSEAKEYLESNNVLHLINQKNQKIEGRKSPDFRDLARLFATVRARKVFTILEFGIGYSTMIMASALKKNYEDWQNLKEKPLIRNSTPFQIYSVDASSKWIEVALSGIPQDYTHIVKAQKSTVVSSTFNGKICHFYNEIPNVIPDFIYLDGPSTMQIKNKDNTSSAWNNNRDRVVMSGDLLRIEPVLLPGTCILVDGRTANARFLSHLFYRRWAVQRDSRGDVTAMELQEPPLGDINQSTLHYTLGKRIDKWTLN